MNDGSLKHLVPPIVTLAWWWSNRCSTRRINNSLLFITRYWQTVMNIRNNDWKKETSFRRASLSSCEFKNKQLNRSDIKSICCVVDKKNLIFPPQTRLSLSCCVVDFIIIMSFAARALVKYIKRGAVNIAWKTVSFEISRFFNIWAEATRRTRKFDLCVDIE